MCQPLSATTTTNSAPPQRSATQVASFSTQGNIPFLRASTTPNLRETPNDAHNPATGSPEIPTLL